MLRKARANILILVDIFLLNLSLTVAYFLKFEGIGSIIPEKYARHFLLLALLSTIIKVICNIGFKLYKSLWEFAGVTELLSAFLAAAVGNGIMEIIVLLDFAITGSLLAPRSIFVITFLIDMMLIGGVRLVYRVYRRLVKGEKIRLNGAKRVMIIGAGASGSAIIKDMRNNPKLKYFPAVVIDDDPEKHGKKLNGVPIAGGREIIAEAAKRKSIDEIMIAVSSACNKEINEIYAECSKTSCKVKILPSISQLINQSVVLQRMRDFDIEDLLGREPVKLKCEEVTALLEGMSVMVTGGGGSIGSELCRQICVYKPSRLIILDNYENNLFDILNELEYRYVGLEIEPVIANIRDRSRIDEIMSQYKPDVVFHAAAHKHVPLMELNPTEAIKNNVTGTLNVAESSDKFGVKRFVLISSDKAVNPTNVMGATKRIAELIIQALDRHSKTEFVAVRFGNVLGSSGSVVPLFKKQIERGGPVTVTHEDVIRYFMTIPEAVQLVLQAGAMANGGEVFVLDMGNPVKIYDLAKNLIRLSGFEPGVDIEIKITGLRPGEKLFEELLLSEEGMQKTRNERIFIAKPVITDMATLNRNIRALQKLAEDNPEGVVEHIHNIVPTFEHAENGYHNGRKINVAAEAREAHGTEAREAQTVGAVSVGSHAAEV